MFIEPSDDLLRLLEGPATVTEMGATVGISRRPYRGLRRLMACPSRSTRTPGSQRSRTHRGGHRLSRLSWAWLGRPLERAIRAPRRLRLSAIERTPVCDPRSRAEAAHKFSAHDESVVDDYRRAKCRYSVANTVSPSRRVDSELVLSAGLEVGVGCEDDDLRLRRQFAESRRGIDTR